MNKTVIIIPARYGSTRFPGKPLAIIAGKTLLQHVCEAANIAAKQLDNVAVVVATDDDRIMQHAQDINTESVLTPSSCATGTDRVYAAVQQLGYTPTNIINLQGDAPLTPPKVIIALIQALEQHPVVTPVIQLSWQDLDHLRSSKLNNAFSGTSVIVNSNHQAIWFSKNIIPAIRNEARLRETSILSPVFQHLGIYGYSYEMLKIFTNLPESHYEQLEGLEQLRFLENDYTIQTIKVTTDSMQAWSGVDTPDDAKFVQDLISKRAHT